MVDESDPVPLFDRINGLVTVWLQNASHLTRVIAVPPSCLGEDHSTPILHHAQLKELLPIFGPLNPLLERVATYNLFIVAVVLLPLSTSNARAILYIGF